MTSILEGIFRAWEGILVTKWLFLIFDIHDLAVFVDVKYTNTRIRYQNALIAGLEGSFHGCQILKITDLLPIRLSGAVSVEVVPAKGIAGPHIIRAKLDNILAVQASPISSV